MVLTVHMPCMHIGLYKLFLQDKLLLCAHVHKNDVLSSGLEIHRSALVLT